MRPADIGELGQSWTSNFQIHFAENNKMFKSSLSPFIWESMRAALSIVHISRSGSFLISGGYLGRGNIRPRRGHISNLLIGGQNFSVSLSRGQLANTADDCIRTAMYILQLGKDFNTYFDPLLMELVLQFPHRNRVLF